MLSNRRTATGPWGSGSGTIGTTERDHEDQGDDQRIKLKRTREAAAKQREPTGNNGKQLEATASNEKERKPTRNRFSTHPTNATRRYSISVR